jgi:hypothetical protein
MFPVKIDERTEVRVKDTAYVEDGWQLWVSLWVDGAWREGSEGPTVPDLEDETLDAAARVWFKDRPNSNAQSGT